jgi:hypothetical protein
MEGWNDDKFNVEIDAAGVSAVRGRMAFRPPRLRPSTAAARYIY